MDARTKLQFDAASGDSKISDVLAQANGWLAAQLNVDRAGIPCMRGQ